MRMLEEYDGECPSGWKCLKNEYDGDGGGIRRECKMFMMENVAVSESVREMR